MTDTAKPVADRVKFDDWYNAQPLDWVAYCSRSKAWFIWQTALSTQGQPVSGNTTVEALKLAKETLANAIWVIARYLPNHNWLPRLREDMEKVKQALVIASQQPVAATGDDERPGMVAAARWIAKRRDDYLRDNCGSSFGTWDLKDAQAEYVGELSEIEEHLLLMAGATCRDKTQYVGSTGMCLLCGADQGVSCRAAQRTAQADGGMDADS